MFSFASSANLYWALHFSHLRGASRVGLSQNASILSDVRLLAGCAMSYSACFVYALAMRERTTFTDRISQSKIANNSSAELAAQDQEGEATEFELENRKITQVLINKT